MQSILFKFAIFLIAISALAARAQGVKVLQVIDGDTLLIRLAQGGKPMKLRIDGVDAPEICQAGGRAARAALAGRVANRMVQVTITRRDDYARAVSSVHLGDEDIAGWMVRHGHAWAYSYGRESGPYLPLQAMAKAERRGVHADPRALPPRSFRRWHGSCRF